MAWLMSSKGELASVLAEARCRRSVRPADYTCRLTGDDLLREVNLERSQLEQVSKHPSDVEERLGPDDSESIDEPPFRDGLQIFALGVARMIEARLSRIDLNVRR